MPSLLIIIPLLAVLILNLPLGRIMNRASFWVTVFLCAAQARLAVDPTLPFWREPLPPLSDIFRSGTAVDDLSLVMFLAVALVTFSSVMLCRYWCEDEERRFNFVSVILLTMVGMNGIVLAGDLFTLYVFIEIAAVASFVLIAFERGRDECEGSFKYIVLSAVASAMMLASIGIFLMFTGGVSFAEAGEALKGVTTNPLLLLAVALFAGGLFIKSGLVPFHGWLPDAYSAAPAPASVLLAGVVTKAAGVYTLMRLTVEVFGITPALQSVLVAVGLASIVIGALAAIGQRDVKRMLAYSSISQVGYIILGLGVGTPLGFAGAIFHLFNHAVFKSLLFINAAAVERETGTRDMREMGGIAKRMPVTGLTSVVAVLSTAGIPPLSGFWSKLVIIVAAWSAGRHGAAATAIMASLVTLAYFLIMQRKMFFGLLDRKYEGISEAGGFAVVPSILLALVTVCLGFAAPWLFETFLLPVRSIL
ncbi:MAG TPA: proton-conducting transporter membrane subunit [bacterium]|nr:proton-conducting transporter membrane subunit [bacterium]